MLEGEYDLDYRSVPQERGNSGIRQARLRILGGCSTANTMISWRPRVADLREWVDLGAARLGRGHGAPVLRAAAGADHAGRRRRTRTRSWPTSSPAPARRWSVPVQDALERRPDRSSRAPASSRSATRPETNTRSSTSICYLHPARASRANLTFVLGLRALRVLLLDGGNRGAPGVRVRDADGATATSAPAGEVVLCAGAIDSPAAAAAVRHRAGAPVLEAAGVEVRVDLPGVGENLQDHVEGLVVWEVDADHHPRSAPAAGTPAPWSRLTAEPAGRTS